MQLTIHKGMHRPLWGFLCSRIWSNKRKLTRKVWFHASCLYKLPDEDHADVNKLFGIGFFPGHHENSARFGWNSNADQKTINLFAYTYKNGVRSFEKICEVDVCTDYALTIEVMTGIYRFRVLNLEENSGSKELIVSRGRSSRWSFYLGLFFGGNRRAPHTMRVIIE